MDHDQISWDLYRAIQDSEYADQLPRLMEEGWGDIDPSFLGFMATYKLLAELIPKGRTVIDLGCATGFQAWYFKDHKAYIGVDGWRNGTDGEEHEFLRTKNSTYYRMNIIKFIDYLTNHGVVSVSKNTFAICNYVPTDTDKIRETFSDLYVFYPEVGDYPEDDAMMRKLMGRK